MYVGHAGIALLATGVRPRLPLWLLLIAAFCVDLLEVALKLVGLEMWVPQPAEALPIAAGLAVGFGIVGGLWTRTSAGALILAAVALTHPLGDLVTGSLPLWIGGPAVGADLFRQPWLDLLVEGALVLGGWLVYRRTLSDRARRSWAVWAIPVVLALCQAVFYAR
jgi:hypothetical protein